MSILIDSDDDHDFTAHDMKQAVLGRGLNEKQNRVLAKWFKRKTDSITKKSSKQNQRWNSVSRSDRNYVGEKTGYKELRMEI